MSIMRKLVAASGAVTALAVGGAIALAVAGGSSPAAADAGATITASATNLPQPSSSAEAPISAPVVAAVPPAVTSSEAAPPAATHLTEQQAIAIALGQAPGASVDRVRTEPEHGAVVWKVDLVTGGNVLELRIDAGTGAIVRSEVDGVDDDDDGASHDVRDDDGSDDAAGHDLGDDHGGDDH